MRVVPSAEGQKPAGTLTNRIAMFVTETEDSPSSGRLTFLVIGDNKPIYATESRFRCKISFLIVICKVLTMRRIEYERVGYADGKEALNGEDELIAPEGVREAEASERESFFRLQKSYF